MKPPTLIVILVLLAFAGCGSDSPEDQAVNLEDQIRSGWDAHYPTTEVPAEEADIAFIKCNADADRDFDGWCAVGIERYLQSGDGVVIPYRDDEILWGEAAAASS